jgi:hypothetical protein
VDSITGRLQPAALMLLEAWSRLPRQDGVPSRASFDPLSVARILPVISLIQRIGADEWRVRLAGTELERRWGRPLTGLNYADVMSPPVTAITFREFEAICSQPCGSWSLRHLELQSGRRLETDTLRLPLRASDGSISLILTSNGELGTDLQCRADPSREIVTVVEQRFLDIGAGIPALGSVEAAARDAGLVTTPARRPYR